MLPRSKPTYSYKEILKVFKHTLMGSDITRELELALANYYHVKHVVLFSKAREALFSLLRAYNDPGEVLIPAYNCIVVPEAIKLAGYQPIFVDIDLNTLNFRPDDLANKISAKTKAILITHQFGIPAEIDLFLELCKKHKLLAIEDAAPAFGANYHDRLVGTFGDAAILSFDKTKVLSGVGGGALVTNNDEIAARVQHNIPQLLPPRSIVTDSLECLAFIIATHDRLYPLSILLYRLIRTENLYEIATIASKEPDRYSRQLSKFQSGLILVQISRINQILEQKRKIAHLFLNELSSDTRFRLPSIPLASSPVWSQFPILTTDKEEIFWHMRKLGVDLSWNYKYSCPESYGINGYPNSHVAAKSVLGLPTYPSLEVSHCKAICEKITQ